VAGVTISAVEAASMEAKPVHFAMRERRKEFMVERC
jgi:hypothetical protein